MISLRHSKTSPEIVVEAEGSVSGADVRRELAPMRDLLEDIEPGFVLMTVYPNLVMLQPDAIGALFYYVARVFDANPGLFILVDGGRSPHPGLRSFVQQLGIKGQVEFAATVEEAELIIERRANEA
ncbi:hypothetical protein CRI94_10800 [Longibacter salinarum]|uniref:STAS domain-containing protein n=1 Tax=Longibacter salinarum TaxID=1850348 RepID=A0A2A8CWZ1_9BACT|nr:hypothetical protein [Longibacter salinarum]PEN13130.1 hypothetical protein CRI94_10800 [Longibacter salinarum]